MSGSDGRSIRDPKDDILELTDIHEDTAVFGELVEDLMRRTSHQHQQGTAPSTTSTTNHSMIRHLKIDGYGGLREPPWRESRNIDLFFHALTLHPLASIRLENLGMYPYDERSGTFPIRLLTKLLQPNGTAPSCLCELELRDVILEGSAEEWRQFSWTLASLNSLQIFLLETCDCAINFPAEQFTNFNQVLRNLWAGPLQSKTLQHLTLHPAQNYGGDLDSATISTILRQSPSLQKLSISNIGRLNNDIMTSLFISLATHSQDGEDETTAPAPSPLSLRFLQLKNCEMNQAALTAMSQFLECQQPSLKSIQLGLSSTPKQRDIPYIYRESSMVGLFETLKHNRTLEKFVLSSDGMPPKMGTKASKAYLDMMRHNCSLLDMFVTYPNLHFHPNLMGFYAKLNRVGRRRFLLDGHLRTRDEWVDMLACVADDESCLFYFLRLHPLLCKI